eukprot:COSAG02_NODE_114_length_35585_cov_149.458293_5_plen_92_part_00
MYGRTVLGTRIQYLFIVDSSDTYSTIHSIIRSERAVNSTLERALCIVRYTRVHGTETNTCIVRCSFLRPGVKTRNGTIFQYRLRQNGNKSN